MPPDKPRRCGANGCRWGHAPPPPHLVIVFGYHQLTGGQSLIGAFQVFAKLLAPTRVPLPESRLGRPRSLSFSAVWRSSVGAFVEVVSVPLILMMLHRSGCYRSLKYGFLLP